MPAASMMLRDRNSSAQQDGCPSLPLQPPPDDSPVAEAFCLMYLEVEAVDHLSLKTNERERFTRAAAADGGGGGGWRVERVNP